MPTDLRTPAGTEPLIDRLRRAVIGRYDVYAELGAGGMASVFLALDLALDRKVAIKVMSPALMDSSDNIERFKREAKVSASLNHPHIIGIHAVGDDPDLAYFVMKYIEGRALDSVIRDEGAQSVPFVQSVIGSAGKALHYAHSRGVVHRDVKPANFMIDQDGWLVVTDFGIAKQGDAKGLTVTGSIIGTPYYMAPEQFSGKPVTGAADQYALGVVAYELLTAAHPYPGDTIPEIMKGHLFDEVPHVRAVRPEVPAELDACIARMMAKDPAERFANLEEAVVAIGAISATQEVVVRTQIIELAKIGAAQQPQMSVPLSPIPAQRPRAATVPSAAATAPAAGATVPLAQATLPAAPVGTGTAPGAVQPEAGGAKSRLPLVAAAVVVAGVAIGAWVVKGRDGAEPPAQPAAATVDSVAIRDSIARVAAAARADSIVRADSVARALARADSVARLELARTAAARAAQARQGSTATQLPRQSQPTTTARPTAPAPTQPSRGPAKDGAGGPTTRRP